MTKQSIYNDNLNKQINLDLTAVAYKFTAKGHFNTVNTFILLLICVSYIYIMLWIYLNVTTDITNSAP